MTQLAFGDLIGGDHEDAAVPIEPIAGFVQDEHTAQRSRVLGHVSRGLFVYQNEIETHAARSKETLGSERFAKQWGVGIADAHQHDRVVARDPSTPKVTLARTRGSPRVGWSTQ